MYYIKKLHGLSFYRQRQKLMYDNLKLFIKIPADGLKVLNLIDVVLSYLSSVK